MEKIRFPPYFRHFRPEKNFSYKSDSVIFWAKNQKKLMNGWKKKTVFPAYFRHFRPERNFFRKSGSITFLALPFCIFVPNFMKKYQVQLEIFKKYCFSGENWLFRLFLDNSGFKNQFFWQLKHAWWWALLSIMFLREKTTKYEEKTQTKSAKTAISGIFPAFSAD